jgi:hypothetical protein
MQIVQPPAKLLLGEDLLIGKIGAPALRKAIPLRQRYREVRTKRIFSSPPIIRVKIKPIESFPALNVGFQVILVL